MRRETLWRLTAKGRIIRGLLRLVLTAACLGGFLVAPVPAARAAWVSGFDDVIADDGVCTLREAIKAANTNTASGSMIGECLAGASGYDLVTLGTGTYTLSIAGTGTNDIDSGDLDVTEQLHIRGVGAERTIIDADWIDRVLEVYPGVSLILEDLTITGGLAPNGADSVGYGAGFGQPGGGVYNRGGTLTLRRCVVRQNAAGNGGMGTGTSDDGGSGGHGGGIASEGGTLTLEDTTIAYNHAGSGGNGGIYSGDGGAGGFGGGIYITGGATLVRSVVYGNRGGTGGNNGSSGGLAGHGGFGGGIYTAGTLSIVNTTVSGNAAGNGYAGVERYGGMGGGIANGGGTLALQQSSVVGNVTGDGYTAGNGGGLYGTSSSVNNAQNSIIANNGLGLYVGAPPQGPDCHIYLSSLNSQGYNLIENTADCTIVGDVAANIYGTDPALLSLANNGGATLTHALQAASPAKDHIPTGISGCGSSFTTDQRGRLRPSGGACDIGAIEMQATEAVAEVSALLAGETYPLPGAYAALTLISGDPLTVTVNRQNDTPDNVDDFRALPAHWNITAAGDSYAVDLGLCYTDDEAVGLDETALDIYRWDAYEAVWVDQDGTLDTLNNCITATGVTSFSTWMVAAPRLPIYVDADATTGANTGVSWADAFTDLQDALGAAEDGDEIWVAEGTYKPTTGSDRTVAFAMVSGVGIYGGFAGAETDRSRRDWAAHTTTLSGDIGTVGDGGDNSYHVVVAGGVTGAVLDGFSITLGRADVQSGTDNNGRGGGMLVEGGAPTIRNCVIVNNGAVYFGGGLAVQGGSTAIVAETTFLNNAVTYYGGGMASVGGSSPTIANARFLGNRTGGSGSGGGAVSAQSSTPRHVNVIFSGNTAGNEGGGFYNWDSGAQFINVTFSHNHASFRGGALSNSSPPSVVNGIFWDNSAGSYPEIYPTGYASAVTYSIVKGGYSGTGNLNADPAFVDADGADGVAGTPDDDLTVYPGSPAIDAGNNGAVPPDVADLDGDGDTGEVTPLDLGRDPRFVGEPEPDTGVGTPPLVDRGAYEKQRTCWVRLNDSATDYTTVQAAVDAATNPDDVVKVAGICGGASERNGLTQTLMMTKTLTVQGGYTPTFDGAPDPVANPTTLTAAGKGRVIVIRGGVSPVIRGLRITGGDATGQGGAGPDDAGGGIFVEGGAPEIRDCWIFGNTAPVGGGVVLANTTGALIDNEILENVAEEGGGIATGMAEPTLTGNRIHHNVASDIGGGISYYQAGGTASGNVIRDNEAAWDAGGILIRESSPSLINNVILANEVTSGGRGGILVESSMVTLLHNTIAGNAGGDGFGLYVTSAGSAVTLTNTIVAGQTTGIGVESDSTVVVDGVLWFGNDDNIDGDGTITILSEHTGDPAFETDGYHLMEGSAAIDAGVVTHLTTDIDGDPRPLGAGFDIGADEFGVASDFMIYLPLVIRSAP
jgi:CSLREA domain-containing protein